MSARNQPPGTITKIGKGVTTARATIRLGGGAGVAAPVTNEAVDEAGLDVDKPATAVVKSSDAMVGVGG